MPMLQWVQVDAFTTKPFAGNPCAVVFDADELSADQMQQIALEMNLSETAFLMRSDVADVRARYFTPAEEIPLAGHPTIASIFALIETERLVINGEPKTVSLQLEAGVIPVDILVADESPIIRMTQLKPTFMDIHDPEVIMPVLGLTADDLIPDMPIQTVSTGTPQLMLPVKSLDILRRANVNGAAYRALRAESDFRGPHLFCTQGITNQGSTFARHFGTLPDTYEDPFTGSATGGMAAYLWRYGLIDEPEFVAEQGHWMNRPGKAIVERVGTANDIEAVRVGGQAVMVMRGEILV